MTLKSNTIEVYTLHYRKSDTGWYGYAYIYDLCFDARGKTKKIVKDVVLRKMQKRVNFRFKLIEKDV